MAKTTTTEWAIGPWSRRGSLNYVPIDQPFNGAYFTERPGSRNAPPPLAERIPYKVEDTGSGVTYIAYSSSDDAEILRYTEE
jgi:hypothetical protein